MKNFNYKLLQYDNDLLLLLYFQEMSQATNHIIRILEHSSYSVYYELLFNKTPHKLPSHNEFVLWHYLFNQSELIDYSEEFLGLYINHEKIINFYQTYLHSLNRYETALLKLLKPGINFNNNKIQKKRNSKISIIVINEQSCDSEHVIPMNVELHELSHYIFHYNKQYANIASKTIKQTTDKEYKKIKKMFIDDLNYEEEVIVDEFAASIAGENNIKLNKQIKNFSSDTQNNIKKLKNIFNEKYKQFKPYKV